MRQVKVHISSSLSEEEWMVLRHFCDKARRLNGTKLMSSGAASIRGNIRYEEGRGLWFETELPPEEEIAEFLMSFRFFYLEKEVTHVPSILRMIGRHAGDADSTNTLRELRKQWENNLFRMAMVITLNDVQLTSRRLLDLWFNAHYFHSDSDKQEQLCNLRNVFSDDFAKYMLLDAAFEGTKVINKVDRGIEGIVEERFGV